MILAALTNVQSETAADPSPVDDTARGGALTTSLLPSGGAKDAAPPAPASVAGQEEEEEQDDARDPDDPVDGAAPAAACCCIKWKYAWMVGVYTFLATIPIMITKPLLIEVQKDYFGSDKTAAMWFSVIQSVVAFFNVFLFVAYGRLLDSLGRKPFFIAAALAQLLCYASLAAFPRDPIIFMILSGASGLVQSSYTGAFIADTVTPENRSYAFTIVAAVGTMGLVTSLPLGFIHAPNMVFYLAAVGFSLVALLFVIFVIPESLPKHNRKPFQLKGTFGNPLKGASVLIQSRAMRLISVSACIVVMADVGTKDVFMYYLNDRVGFDSQDNAFFFVEISFMSLFGFFVVTPLMLKYVSTITVLCVAIASNAALLILTATVWAPWCVFAFIGPMYGLLVMGSPLINTMVTNIGHEREVGQRITAMAAVTDVCNAAGPLIFGVLYGQLPRGLMALPFLFFAAMILANDAYLWFRLGKAIREDQAAVQEDLRAEALARGEDGGGVTASGRLLPDPAMAPNAAGGAARALYHDEDCE